jgi:hypothetical protein
VAALDREVGAALAGGAGGCARGAAAARGGRCAPVRRCARARGKRATGKK